MNAYNEGKQAARAGMGWSTNPYLFETESTNYEQWLDGWHDENANKSKDPQPNKLDD